MVEGLFPFVVDDNEPVTWSLAGNTLSPAPFSPFSSHPWFAPASFSTHYQLEKKKVANEGFFVDKFWGRREAP
jgi:hypothetical protein